MAVNESRNLSRDLREGLTDGSVKKAARDRGGEVEYQDGREGLPQDMYGYSPSDPRGTIDSVASRLHDGQILGESQQDTEYTWYKTQV